jgi:transcription antitermination factor NusG
MHDLDWYVLMVATRGEDETRKRIERDLNLTVVLPTGFQITRRGGQPRLLERVVFPGYLFIGFEAVPDWMRVLDVEGVRAVIKNDSEPLRLRSSLVVDLFMASICGGFNERLPGSRLVRPHLRPGDRVKAIGGHLGEFCGKVLRSRGKNRVEVMFEFLGHEKRAVMSLDDLQRVA